MKILVIGGGNMGGAVYRALVKNVSLNDLNIVDRNADKLAGFAGDNKFLSLSDVENFKDIDTVILAMKPQVFAEFTEGAMAEGYDFSNRLVISLLAGVTISNIQQSLQAETVVRTMPNLGSQVGEGMTGWVGRFGTGKLNKTVSSAVGELLSHMGKEIELESEEQLDLITGVSGSGPAYFFLMAELLTKAAEELGLPAEMARLLGEQTLIGAGAVLAADGGKMTAAQWREAVTSKGGATAEALKIFSKYDFSKIVSEAVGASNSKAKLLSK